MNNFLDFIEKDIEAKKTLFNTMPTNTKTEIKKFNNRIDEVFEKYDEYKKSVKKYIDTKAKSYEIIEINNKLEKAQERVANLEHIRFILNPLNTYFEKMGFDNLLFEISNYYDFNFKSLNENIEKFLQKFEEVGIKLDNRDFNYTCYVNEFMSTFLESRVNKNKNYAEISKIFEKIYWTVPEIVQHIELNFRKLIRKHEWKFINYIEKIQSKIKLDNEISSYEECLLKLKDAYVELNFQSRENITDVIELSKKRVIDINNYFPESKVRISTFNDLIIDSSNINDEKFMAIFYENLQKLKINIEEYINYNKFIPLIDNFKSEYIDQIPKEEKNSKNTLITQKKKILSEILAKERKLKILNWKIMNENSLTLILRRGKDLKQLKINSVKCANELYGLYQKYEQEYFKEKVFLVLKPTMTILELLHLYYSFDYFKKTNIKKIYQVNSYDEIINYSDSFDIFSMNPTNVVINDVALFEETNIGQTIMNKYRLDNINLTEENLDPDALNLLVDKIDFILRVNIIEKSFSSFEKIWFMSRVHAINETKNKK